MCATASLQILTRMKKLQLRNGLSKNYNVFNFDVKQSGLISTLYEVKNQNVFILKVND